MRWRRTLRRSLGVVLVLFSVALVALFSAVDTLPLDANYPGPTPLPPEVAARFAYPEHGTPVHVEAIWDEQDHGAYTTRWAKLVVTTPGHEAHVAQVIHYRPAPITKRRSAVILSPILGGDMPVARIFARSLARHGLHAVIVVKAEEVFEGAAPPARLEQVLRTAVVDRRRAIDWLQEHPDVAPNQIGAMGVSIGGLATTIFAAVEPRVRASVLVLAGGDATSLVRTSDEPSVQQYARDLGDRTKELRAAVPSDPLLLAPYIDARRVLLVQASRDTTVPFANQELLRKALGNPQRIVVPTGHYTSAIYLPMLSDAAVTFLEEQLGALE